MIEEIQLQRLRLPLLKRSNVLHRGLYAHSGGGGVYRQTRIDVAACIGDGNRQCDGAIDEFAIVGAYSPRLCSPDFLVEHRRSVIVLSVLHARVARSNETGAPARITHSSTENARNTVGSDLLSSMAAAGTGNFPSFNR